MGRIGCLSRYIENYKLLSLKLNYLKVFKSLCRQLTKISPTYL